MTHLLILCSIALATVLCWAGWMILIAAIDTVRQRRLYRRSNERLYR